VATFFDGASGDPCGWPAAPAPEPLGSSPCPGRSSQASPSPAELSELSSSSDLSGPAELLRKELLLSESVGLPLLPSLVDEDPFLFLCGGVPSSPGPMRTDARGAGQGGAAVPVRLRLLLSVGACAPPLPGPVRTDGAGAREGGAAPVGLRLFLDGGAWVPLRFFRRDSMVGGGAASGRGKLGVGEIPAWVRAAPTRGLGGSVGGLRNPKVVQYGV
jgi:hypothetical protein